MHDHRTFAKADPRLRFEQKHPERRSQAPQAAVIVSGDTDLLAPGAFEKIPILTASAFLASLTPLAEPDEG